MSVAQCSSRMHLSITSVFNLSLCCGGRSSLRKPTTWITNKSHTGFDGLWGKWFSKTHWWASLINLKHFFVSITNQSTFVQVAFGFTDFNPISWWIKNIQTLFFSYRGLGAMLAEYEYYISSGSSQWDLFNDKSTQLKCWSIGCY